MALMLSPPGSRTEELPEKLAELGRTRKRTAVATGLFAFAAACIFFAGSSCCLDAAFHLPPLARAFALTLALALGGILWIRGVVRAMAYRTDPLAIALELEERYPSLNDALASAVTFLAESAEDRGVSNRLQRVAVRSAEKMLDRHEIDRLIPSSACWRAGWLCAIVVAGTIPLFLANPSTAITAVVRLADPFGTHPWPTKTRIEILAPEHLPARVPKDEAFAIKFAVRGVIPERAIVVFRLNSGEEFEEQYPLTGTDTRGAAIVFAQIDPGQLPTSFAFRILANDCETPMQSVDVVPPPRLVNFSGRASPQFHVTPPEYTGLPSGDLPDGAGILEIPVGTVVRIHAAADVRLSSAQLAFQGDKAILDKASPVAAIGQLNPLAAAAALPLAQEIGSDFPLTLDGDRRIISGEFVPAMSGIYALKLNDETGLTGKRLIEIRLIPDPAPIVTLVRPSPSKDPTILVPTARIAVHSSADDKVYGLRRGFLEYRVGPEGTVRMIPLFDLRDAVRALPAALGGIGATVRIGPTSNEAVATIPVAAFKREDGTPVRAGDVVFLCGAADDWDDVTICKPPGRSGEVELQIATADAIEALLQKELTAIRPDLVRMRDQQREGRQKTAEAVPLPDGSLSPIDRDRLLSAEQLQRQIRGKLNDPRDGVRTKADLLRETVRANALPKSTTTDRIAALADELGRLSERELNAIEANLDDARQVGGQPVKPGQEGVVAEHLKKAARHQKDVEDGLTNLIDALSVWGGAAEIRGEARILRDRLNRQAEDADKLGEKVPTGKAAESLSALQKADLERAAGKAELAAEQAGSILARAARLAAEKDKQADALKAAALQKGNESEVLRNKADALLEGNPEKSTSNAKAAAAKSEADDLKALAEKAAAEAEAIRKGIDAAGGPALTDELRRASDELRNNKRVQGAESERAAADRLAKLTDALAEKVPETAPDLAKLKKIADELNELADSEDSLRKRAAEAAKIPDAAEREAELKKLALEQEKLIQRGREVLQRLTRERADAAARDTRAALDKMEASRDDLEKGKSGAKAQDEATELLDNSRDRIDRTTSSASDQLSSEKRRKMADRIAALLEKQKAAASEADRIHSIVAKDKKWERPLLASYADLEERERVLVGEVRSLSEKEFASLPVLARLLSEAAENVERAAEKIKIRREDALDADPTTAAFDAELEASNDRKIKRPMTLAARRLEQLLAALKEEPTKSTAKKDPQAEGQPKNPNDPMAQPKAGEDGDVVPPLAQLKVLKALQGELNERTAEFAKAHPDLEKLSEDEREELKDLERAQRDIAELFERLAKLFQQGKPDAPENPQ